MNSNMDQIPHKKTFAYLLITLLILTILFLLVKLSSLFGIVFFFVKTIFLPFFIAVIISYLLHPIVSVIHNRGVPRSLAVLFIYIIFFGSIIIISVRTFPLLLSQIKDFADQLPEITHKFEGWMDGIRHDHSNPLPDTFQDGIDATLEDIETTLSEGFTHVLEWVSNALGFLFTLLLVPFVAFYILKDYKLLEKTIMTFVPKKNRKEMIRLTRDIDEALGNYIRGQLIVCVVIGGLAYIGFLIIGLPYALLLAFIISITNIIPYLGPFIGAAPAIIVGLSISWKMAISVLVVNLIIQMIEGNVVSPMVVGRKLHIHPLFIILALLVGGELAGIVGLILAVPIFAIIKVIVQHIGLYYSSR